MSYYQYADKFPPILVRLLARKRNGPPITTKEISIRCAEHGWPMSSYRIGIISANLDWDDIPFGEMRAFLTACECDFTDFKAMDRKDAYMRVEFKSAKFLYLHESPEWGTVLEPLVQRYRQYLADKIK